MSAPYELEAAAADPRMPPTWFFVAFGSAVATILLLTHTHAVLGLAGLPLFLVLAVVQRRRGHDFHSPDPKSVIALHAPLPGWGLQVLGTMIAIVALFVVSGPFYPGDGMPFWAAAISAIGVGAASALLIQKSQLRQLAAVRRLEADSDR